MAEEAKSIFSDLIDGYAKIEIAKEQRRTVDAQNNAEAIRKRDTTSRDQEKAAASNTGKYIAIGLGLVAVVGLVIALRK